MKTMCLIKEVFKHINKINIIVVSINICPHLLKELLIKLLNIFHPYTKGITH